MFSPRLNGPKSQLATLALTSIPLALCLGWAYFWYFDKAAAERTQTYFVRRQNLVLTNDAQEVAQKVSNLLMRLSTDLHLLALVDETNEAYQRFYDLNRSADGVPLYREITVLTASGREKMRLETGKPVLSRSLDDCRLSDLCDPDLWRAALKMAAGEIRFGKVVKFYSPKTSSEDIARAGLRAFYRQGDRLYALTLDYFHLSEIKRIPVFPYDRDRGPLAGYEQGNYIYLVDDAFDFIVHPKHWNVIGVDRDTGKWRTPVVNDADDGQHPLSVSAYRGDKLRSYFDRLLRKSFRQKEIDLFQASNLKGMNRVLSVAPILFNQGQYQKTGLFGFVVVGCAVEYFEEPKEQTVPYY